MRTFPALRQVWQLSREEAEQQEVAHYERERRGRPTDFLRALRWVVAGDTAATAAAAGMAAAGATAEAPAAPPPPDDVLTPSPRARPPQEVQQRQRSGSACSVPLDSDSNAAQEGDASASAKDSSAAQTEFSDDDCEDDEWVPGLDESGQQTSSQLRSRHPLQQPTTMVPADVATSAGCSSKRIPATRSSAVSQQRRSRPASQLPNHCASHDKTMPLRAEAQQRASGASR
jgi:hypothetical protein